MAEYVLYGPASGNKNVLKAQLAAKYAGIQLSQPPFQMGVENKSPEFLAKNPNGKIPLLDTPQGSIWESNAIARYLARFSDTGLFGTTSLETAKIEQWIDFATISIDSPLSSWAYPLLYPAMVPYDKKKETAAIASVKSALEILNTHLTGQTFIVGDSITLADLITYCQLWNGYKKVFDEGFRTSFPAVTRWFLTVANQPLVKSVDSAEIASEGLKFTPPAKEAKKETPKPAAAKPTPAAKPASEAQAPATPAAEEPPKPAEKPKDPLAALPPSKMIMDSWKRLYSNTPSSNFSHCTKGLWTGADVPNSPTNEHFEGFDAEGYSIFFIDYKYPEENTVNFIVMNKVGGFLQRIDYVRKHAFAAICILKDSAAGTFPIRGLFIFRGQDIPPIMKDECYDVDLYNWQKVDTSDEAQRRRVEQILEEDATIDGLENVEVKVFK